jgi:hypothetical protein
MQPSRTLDATLAATVALCLSVVALFVGDPLYVGFWYYLVVPAVALGLAAAFRAKPLFLFGTSLAVTITLIAYMSINWRATRPEGLLALGHLCSLPGAGVGIVLGALSAKRVQRPIVVLLLSLLGLLSGFFINQLIVCNTVMWCGPLSMDIR